jgi:quinoprotein glucose dehydrogenase
MRYSSLRQINTGNVERLQPAWTFRTGKPGSEAVPVVIGGVMYVNAPDGVYALVPETGELLWKHDASPVALRGLAYWPGLADCTHACLRQRPLPAGARRHDGKARTGFGNEGRVDLLKGVLGDLSDARFVLQSPPAVFGDVVITGSSNGEGSPTAGAYGDIRGWDARSGKLLWTFHTVPRPGEPGSETWPPDAWKKSLRHEHLGLPHSRFEARDRVRAARLADRRLLRQGSRGRRALREFAGGSRRPHRREEVASPTGASRLMGLRSGRAAGVVRHPP